MRLKFKLLILLCLIGFLSPAQKIEHDHSLQHAFIENGGQWKDDVLFKANFQGGNLWVEQGKMMFHLQDFSKLQQYHASPKDGVDVSEFNQTVLHVNFPGSNEVTSIDKTEPTEAYFNYFLGNDESRWASNVHGYGEAVLNDFYDGIDLKFDKDSQATRFPLHITHEQLNQAY